jgi:hypothetical protein
MLHNVLLLYRRGKKENFVMLLTHWTYIYLQGSAEYRQSIYRAPCRSRISFLATEIILHIFDEQGPDPMILQLDN